MKILGGIGIVIVATWLYEILFLIAAFYDTYMDDVRKYGREQARKMWRRQKRENRTD